MIGCGLFVFGSDLVKQSSNADALALHQLRSRDTIPDLPDSKQVRVMTAIISYSKQNNPSSKSQCVSTHSYGETCLNVTGGQLTTTTLQHPRYLTGSSE